MEPLKIEPEPAAPTPPIAETPAATVETPSPETPHGGDPRHHAIPLRTLSSDMAEAVREQQGKVIKIAIAEDERLAQEKENSSPTSKKNLFFILAGSALVLVTLAGVGISVWYKIKSDRTVAVVVTPVAASIVESEATATLNITGNTSNEIAHNFSTIVADPTNALGTIKNVLVTEGSGTGVTRVPASQFLEALGAHVTPEFSRALSEDYMLGLYTYTSTTPFLVLTGVAHDALLTGMTDWEPYLLQDLGPLLGVNTAGSAAPLLNAPLADTLIENRPTRAILDASGKPVIFYSFLDDDTIFIATDAGTLAEAIVRLHQ